MHSPTGKALPILASAALLFIAAAIAPLDGIAATLRIALAAEVTTLDPHFLNIAPNVAFSSQIFDALVNVDADGKLVPGLAVSWRAVDATTWELKLRQGVRFHDGSPFTADDVLFSLARPATLTNSPGPFTSYTKQIVGSEIVDANTLRLKTAKPYGPLPLDLSTIFIVSSKAADHASTDDFNRGRAVVGTGPFRFMQFRRGDMIELARNDDYWGEKAEWDRVVFRIIPSDAPRLAALLAGDVDAIESVPTADLAHLKADPRFALAQRVSWRTIFWHLDQHDAVARYATDRAGNPLPRNPFLDLRVRKAVSLAINREALASRIMEGMAVPASNLVAPRILGYDDDLQVDRYDPAAARELLKQAGYPDGFSLTIHGPKARYINDEQVVQAVAQFLTHVGIRTSIETQPPSVYFSKARNGEYSMALLGWGTLAGDFGLRALVGTRNPQTGWGSWNWGGYSNPNVDRLVRSALSSVDQQQRDVTAQQAMNLALRDYAVIPLHHQFATWAMRKGLTYTPRIDEFTFAQQFHSR
jgi:peptide/nickel transport system substrate-binding protein